MPPSAGVRSRLTAAHRLLAREMGAFGVVGSAAFVVDVGLFQLLYVAGVEAVVAKLVATLVSMTAAYLGHRYWSFSHRERPGVGREYVTFALVNGVTLLLGLVVIGFVRHVLLQESALVLQAANVGAIVAGTVVRFLSYRRWVFPARAEQAADRAGTAGPRPHGGGPPAPAGDGRPAAAPLG